MTPAYKIWRDPTAYTLVAANIYTLGLVLTKHLNLAQVLWLYWLQGIVIGATTVIRIISLRNYSTEGFRVREQSIPATAIIKLFIAGFFILHYGVFQIVYAAFLAFITIQLHQKGAAAFSAASLLIPLVLFALHHFYSLFRTMYADAGDSNIGSIMAVPYKRIIPMHITIIAGAWFIANNQISALAGLFVGLKTIADVSAHYFEHRSRRTQITQPSTTAIIEE